MYLLAEDLQHSIPFWIFVLTLAITSFQIILSSLVRPNTLTARLWNLTVSPLNVTRIILSPSVVATWKQQLLIKSLIAQKRLMLELLGREPSVPTLLKWNVMPTAFLRNVRSTQLVYTLPLTEITVVKTELPTTLLRKSVFLKTLYPRTLTTTSTVTMFRDQQTRLATILSSAVTISAWPIGETRLTGRFL